MSNIKRNIKPVLGILAFVIGGLITRERALDGIDTIDHVFRRNKPRIEKAKQSAQEIAQTEPVSE